MTTYTGYEYFATEGICLGTYQGLDLDGRKGDFFPIKTSVYRLGLAGEERYHILGHVGSSSPEWVEEGTMELAIVLCGKLNESIN